MRGGGPHWEGGWSFFWVKGLGTADVKWSKYGTVSSGVIGCGWPVTSAGSSPLVLTHVREFEELGWLFLVVH